LSKSKILILAGVLIGVLVLAFVVLPQFTGKMDGGMDVQFYDDEGNPVTIPPGLSFVNGEGQIITRFDIIIEWNIPRDANAAPPIEDLYIYYEIVITVYVNSIGGSEAGSDSIIGNGITLSGDETSSIILSNLIGVESTGQTYGWSISITGYIKASGYINDVGITEEWNGNAHYNVGWSEDGFTLDGNISTG